ncbi:hypothetical protein CU102_12535 [Phyllobacterium brassicacearum]|uniref:Uncharacterized protein n=1 Tax=Phyllobacterium brassicacearum TaxID=314235 RepID=A0A2P7BQ78_9HYPH|nr:hypothetical protein [Phyllobacterium brassicacearum]PSH68585.1 hypothetical protein CU102_12535 [Phyllobacterium brassicacearum]TDQ24132.1 hypothetical protein DEV91_11510 [Phyllobacterium brassicacearum]
MAFIDTTSPDSELTGIRGWLAFMAIGQFTSPIRVLMETVKAQEQTAYTAADWALSAKYNGATLIGQFETVMPWAYAACVFIMALDCTTSSPMLQWRDRFGAQFSGIHVARRSQGSGKDVWKHDTGRISINAICRSQLPILPLVVLSQIGQQATGGGDHIC